jgi:hypothetical protein
VLLPDWLVRSSYAAQKHSGFHAECLCAVESCNFLPFGAKYQGNCFDKKKFVVLRTYDRRKICCSFAQDFFAVM